jgi:hypothetical protein
MRLDLDKNADRRFVDLNFRFHFDVRVKTQEGSDVK